jgi:UDP-N-acetylmuramoylalanine--D-glutamate ligase
MSLIDLAKKNIIVIGSGMSGLAVCRFLLTKNACITLADSKDLADLPPEVIKLREQGVKLLLSNQLPQKATYDLAVKSPGVPPTTSLMRLLYDAGVPVIGEIELAYLFTKATFVAITGTKGKTTTTQLIYEIFKNAGIETIQGGNIGKPLVEIAEDFMGVIVAEISSFQAEDSRSFAPHIALMLNLTPDHLDRHGSMKSYQEAKEKVFSQQKADDYAILNYDDVTVRSMAQGIKSQIVYFSRQKKLSQGVFIENGQLMIALGQKKINVMPIKDIYIKGGHNLENALAAVAVAAAYDIAADIIATTLRNFSGVEHRLEFVTKRKGITYVNDSKATNPESTIQALLAYDEPIILIAGGRDKGSDFSRLIQMVKERVVFLSLVGEARYQLKEAADQVGFSNYAISETFSEAVEKALAAAKKGQVVMLSPACASWDMFKNYEVRGNLFKEIVLAHQ